jgi:DNA-binding transcriptional regulator YiaG
MANGESLRRCNSGKETHIGESAAKFGRGTDILEARFLSRKSLSHDVGGRISMVDKLVKKKIDSRFTPDQIAVRIRELRKRLQIDQAVFAEHLGVSQGTVSEWEKGDHPPQPMALMAIGRLDFNNAMWWYEQAGPKFAERLKLQQLIRDVREEQKGSAAPSTSLDQDLLAFAVERVDAALEKRRSKLPRDKYAQAVAIFYDLCHETQSRNPAMLEPILRRIA